MSGTLKNGNLKLNQTILKKKWKRINRATKDPLDAFQVAMKIAKKQKARSTYPKPVANLNYTIKLLNQFLMR